MSGRSNIVHRRTPNKRANTVRPYGRDKDFLFGLHTEVYFLIVITIITSQAVTPPALLKESL